MRREYSVLLTINGRRISKVIIDQHYREKRSDLDDQMILEMVKGLHGREFAVVGFKDLFSI